MLGTNAMESPNMFVARIDSYASKTSKAIHRQDPQ